MKVVVLVAAVLSHGLASAGGVHWECGGNGRAGLTAEQELAANQVEKLQAEGMVGEEQVNSEVLHVLQQWMTLESRLDRAKELWIDAEAHDLAGDWDKALKAVNQVEILLASKSSRSSALVEIIGGIRCVKAQILQKLGDNERAFDVLEDLSDKVRLALPWYTSRERFVLAQAGQVALKLGHATKARSYFERAIALDPLNGELHKNLAQSLDLVISTRHKDGLEPELLERVVAHLKRAVRFGSSDIYTVTRLGSLLVEREEWETAGRVLRKAVQQWPESMQLHLQLGRVLHSRASILRNYESETDTAEVEELTQGALTHLQQATWLNASSFDAYFSFGCLLHEEGRLEEALDALSSASKLASSDDEALWLELGLVSAELKHTEPAIEYYQRALNASDSVDRQLELSESLGQYLESQGLLERAKVLYNNLLALQLDDGQHSNVLVKVGSVMFAQGSVSEAQKVFVEAHLLSVSAVTHAGLGDCLHEAGDVVAALEHYEAAIELGGSDVHVLTMAGKLSTDRIRAQELLGRAIRLWPMSSHAHHAMGRFWLAVDPNAACPELQQAIFLDQNCVECLLDLTEAFVGTGKFHRALDAATKAYKLEKENARVHLLMGTVLVRLEHAQGALESFEKAALLSQKSRDSMITAEALTNAAAVYTQRRKPTRAIANLYEAIEHVPSFQAAHESLALLLAATGQSELASKHREIADTLDAKIRHRMTKEVEEGDGFHTKSTPRLEETEVGSGTGTGTGDGREDQEDVSLGSVTTWTHRVASSFHDLKGKLMGSVRKPSHESETADHQTSASSLSMNANSTEDHVNRTSTPKECMAKTPRSRHSGKLLIEEAGSLFQIAGLFAEQGQLEAAVSCFQHVSESNHVELGPAAKLELAILLQKAEPHRAQVLALEAAETFSLEHPKHVDAQLWAAHLLRPSPSLGKATSKSSADGDAGLRLALLLDASRVHSDASEVHHALGVEWLTRGNNQRALTAFQHAEFCLRSNSSVEAADTFFRVASLLETSNPEAASRLLFILNMNPETKSEQVRLASTLPLDLQFPTFDELRTAAKVELGHRYVSLGQGQRASDVLVQVSQELASEPSPGKRAMASRALTDIGQVLLADQQRDIARIFLIAAYASCSNDQALLVTLSESEVHSGPLFWREIALRQEQATHHARLECSADTTRLLALYEEYGMFDQAITLAQQLGNRGTLMKMMAAKASFDESMRLLMTWKDQSDTSVLDLALEMTLSEGIASRSRLLAHALDLATTREEGLEQRVEEEAFKKFPTLSLAYGRYLERIGDSDKALSVFRQGLGSDFEHITANSIAGVLEAYLLILPHMYTVLEATLDRKSVLDSATIQIHEHMARLVSNPGERLLHAWWAIFGSGDRETTSARLELHVIAARAAFELANMLPTSSLSQSALVKLARRDIHQVQNNNEDEERTTAVRCTAAQLSILSKVPEKAIEEVSAITVSSCACKSAALAQAYFTLGNEENALKAYEDTLVAATSPTLECSATDGQASHSGCELKSVDALVQYAQLLEKRGKVDLAIKAFKVALIDFEHLIPAHGKAGLTYAFGNMLFHSGAKMQAVQVLQEAAESMPNHVGTRNNLGATLIRVGQLKEAVKQLEFAFSLCEKATNSSSRDIDFCKVPARVNMAIALENMGDYEGATLQAKAVLAHSRRPGSTIERVAVKRQLARLMLAQNDPGSAVVTLRNTIKSLENELKKTTGAIGTLDERRARERARNLQDLIDTLRDLGLLYSNAEQHDAAVKALKRVLVLSSVGSVNLNENQGGDVGLTSSTVWDLVDIIPVKAVESTLKHPQALVDLGNAFFAAGNFVQAKSIYQWCTKLFPGHGSAYNNLGVIAFRNGEWEAATGNFTKALALDPENEQARSALTQVGEDGPAPWLLDVLPANELPPRSGTKLFVD